MASRTRTEQPVATAPAPAAPGRRAAAEWRRWTPRNHLIACLVALGVGSIVIAAWSLATGGVGWDAPTDTTTALQVRAIPSSDSLSQAYSAIYLNSEFYGVFIQQLGDLFHTLFSGSTQHLQPNDWDTYLYEGGVTLVLSVLSVTALSIAVGLVFRSALAGAFAWALTLSTPLWLGMSHLDFKDIPVAAGLNLITAGLIFGIVIRRPRNAILAGVPLVAVGAGVALATRPGSCLLLAGFLIFSCASFAVWAWASGRPRAALPPAIASVAAVVAAPALVWATNPIARIDLIRWLHDASSNSLAYPWYGPIRVAGGDMQSGHLRWWYVPAWLGAQLPLLTIAALVVGLAALVAGVARRHGTAGGERTIALVPLVLQGVVVPVGILLSGAIIYDGIRHLLFALPALIGLAAGGLSLLDRRLARGTRWRLALPILAVATVGASLFDSARWAPYAYAYINPIAGHNTHSQSWELDYWGTSAREGIARLRKAGFTSVSVQPAQTVGVPFGADSYTGVFGDGAAIYVFSRWGFNAASFGCTPVFTIRRDGHELGEGAQCPPHTTTAGYPS